MIGTFLEDNNYKLASVCGNCIHLRNSGLNQVECLLSKGVIVDYPKSSDVLFYVCDKFELDGDLTLQQ